MQKTLIALLTTGLLALYQISFATAESDSTADWRPIAEITDFEKGIIQQATRQSPDWIYKDAKGFSIRHEVVITILLKDGTIRYFAVSEEKNIDAANNVVTKEAENYTASSPREMALYFANKFNEIWGGVN